MSVAETPSALAAKTRKVVRGVRSENQAGACYSRISADDRGLWHRSPGGRRRHHTHVDQFESKAGDPLQKSLEGALIWQVGSQGCRARAHADLAVVEFRAQHGTCLANESNLIRS
jgi:hypothetical protein